MGRKLDSRGFRGMTTGNLDIVRGQTVSVYGYDCIVRHVDEYGCVLDFPNGEERWVDVEDIAEENEDLFLEDGDDW